jgi:hypothetical protein
MIPITMRELIFGISLGLALISAVRLVNRAVAGPCTGPGCLTEVAQDRSAVAPDPWRACRICDFASLQPAHDAALGGQDAPSGS